VSDRSCLDLSLLCVCAEDFEYTAYPIEDTHEGEPSEYFEESSDIITKIKEDRSLIFVHWSVGKKRNTAQRKK